MEHNFRIGLYIPDNDTRSDEYDKNFPYIFKEFEVKALPEITDIFKKTKEAVKEYFSHFNYSPPYIHITQIVPWKSDEILENYGYRLSLLELNLENKKDLSILTTLDNALPNKIEDFLGQSNSSENIPMSEGDDGTLVVRRQPRGPYQAYVPQGGYNGPLADLNFARAQGTPAYNSLPWRDEGAPRNLYEQSLDEINARDKRWRDDQAFSYSEDQQKARKAIKDAGGLFSRGEGENMLVEVAGSRNAMDIRRRARLADVRSAVNWMKEQNLKAWIRYNKKVASGKPPKSPFKPPYAGWSATCEDVDGDNILDDVVRDAKGNLRYVEGYYLAPQSMRDLAVKKYYGTHTTAQDIAYEPFKDMYEQKIYETTGGSCLTIWNRFFPLVHDGRSISRAERPNKWITKK
jgi:hypothetical protein